MSLLKTFTKVLTVKIWEYLKGFSFKYFNLGKTDTSGINIFLMKFSVKTAYIDYRVKKI